MSNPSADGVTDLVEPIAHLHVASRAFVYLLDADALGHDWVDEINHTGTHHIPSLSLPPHAITLHIHDVRHLNALDLSNLVPEEGATSHCSLYDRYDQWMENWLNVRVTRDGDSVLIEAGLGEGGVTHDGTWNVFDETAASRVRCDADAFAAALECARARAIEVADTLDSFATATADSPWEAWASHPDHAVRERVAQHPLADRDVLIAFAAANLHVSKLLGRQDLPVAALEHIYDSKPKDDSLRRVVNHPNTPRHILEDVARRGANVGRYHSLSKCSAEARARLAKLTIASAEGVDEVFGELRTQLDADPSEHSWLAILATVEAGLARDPTRVAESWVPYARERMKRWRAFDCNVPRTDIAAWAPGQPPRPSWGICKRLALESGNPTPTDDAWRALSASPFLLGLEIIAYFQPPTPLSLDTFAELDLPNLLEFIVSTWGSDHEPLSYDLSRLARARWIGDLHELTISHVSSTSHAVCELLEAARSLSWLSLRHLALEPAHGDILARTGALELMYHLNLNDAPTADIIDSLATHDLPEIHHLSLSNSGFTNAHLRTLCQAPWAPRLRELYLTRNPQITDISPLIAIADQMTDPMIRLEDCAVPPAQAAQLEAILPKAIIRT